MYLACIVNSNAVNFADLLQAHVHFTDRIGHVTSDIVYQLVLPAFLMQGRMQDFRKGGAGQYFCMCEKF